MVGMAQLVSAPDCGSGGRGFESLYPPSLLRLILRFIDNKNKKLFLKKVLFVQHWAIAKR